MCCNVLYTVKSVFVFRFPAIELIKYLQQTEVRDALLNALIALLKPTNQAVHKHKILQGMTSLPVPHEPYILTGDQIGTVYLNATDVLLPVWNGTISR